MPSITPLGIPWNRAAIRLDHRCPSPPSITPGLKDHLRCLLGNLCRASHRWEFPGIGPLSAWNTAAHSSWYNTRTQGPPSPPSSLESLGIGRLSVRIDVAPLVWYNTRPPGFHLPHASVREPYLYHPVLCVCVSLTTILRPPLLCFSFQRTIHTAWYCVNFQRTIGVPSAFKRNKFYTAGISKCFTENSFYSTSRLYVYGQTQ